MKKFKVGVDKWEIWIEYDWRIISLNCQWSQWKFGFWSDWYDGPHRAFMLGPINLYWNW